MKTITLMAGLLLVSAATAQQNDGNRPSWSKGLPERQSAPSVNLEMAEPQSRTVLFEDIHNTSLDEINKGKVEVTEPPLELIPNKTSQLPLPLNDGSHENTLSVFFESNGNKDNSIGHTYDWRVQRMVPVELPRGLAQQHQNVVVKIGIDQLGRVQSVDSVIDGTSEVILRYATKYIKQWRFNPPQQQGITGNLTRVFNVTLLSKG